MNGDVGGTTHMLIPRYTADRLCAPLERRSHGSSQCLLVYPEPTLHSLPPPSLVLFLLTPASSHRFFADRTQELMFAQSRPPAGTLIAAHSSHRGMHCLGNEMSLAASN
jgi:hypothetical protein